jgi:hypothetical protein
MACGGGGMINDFVDVSDMGSSRVNRSTRGKFVHVPLNPQLPLDLT